MHLEVFQKVKCLYTSLFLGDSSAKNWCKLGLSSASGMDTAGRVGGSLLCKKHFVHGGQFDTEEYHFHLIT